MKKGFKIRRAKPSDAEAIVDLIEHGEFLIGSREDMLREIEEWSRSKEAEDARKGS